MRCTIYIVCGKADICVSDIDFRDVNLVKTGYAQSQFCLVMLG